MKVLYVTGACLTKNTSANMSHNGFVKGLIDCGCDVDIIMANSSWGEEDKALPKWESVRYFEYNSVSFADRLRKGYKKTEDLSAKKINTGSIDREIVRPSFRNHHIRGALKRIFYVVFPDDPVYPLDRKWLKSAMKFRSGKEYDLVISNSSPSVGHRLVYELLKAKKIKGKRWLQIWEDPWYHDLYGDHSDAIREEEHFLLCQAQEIFFVSPLTLMYQKKYYSDCADKMKCVPLPFFTFGEEGIFQKKAEELSFGYFGDYYSVTRNLRPFYEALKQSGNRGYIYGDSDEKLIGTDLIEISGRVTLDKLAVVQEKTTVLVHLCNLGGGQIPGKIYHYSATTKPILFILDGTEEEKENIRSFFAKYDRYYFCENNCKAILDTINIIRGEKKRFHAVKDFEPCAVVKRLLHGAFEEEI